MMERGETVIWDRLGGVVEHHIQQANITAQKQKPPSTHVVWQPSSCHPKASTLTRSNSSSTISNHITFDRNFCEMVKLCRSRELKDLFESMWRRHRLRYQASSVPVWMESMQLLMKCCNWVCYTKRNEGGLSIRRGTIYICICIFIFIYRNI